MPKPIVNKNTKQAKPTVSPKAAVGSKRNSPAAQSGSKGKPAPKAAEQTKKKLVAKSPAKAPSKPPAKPPAKLVASKKPQPKTTKPASKIDVKKNSKKVAVAVKPVVKKVVQKTTAVAKPAAKKTGQKLKAIAKPAAKKPIKKASASSKTVAKKPAPKAVKGAKAVAKKPMQKSAGAQKIATNNKSVNSKSVAKKGPAKSAVAAKPIAKKSAQKGTLTAKPTAKKSPKPVVVATKAEAKKSSPAVPVIKAQPKNSAPKATVEPGAKNEAAKPSLVIEAAPKKISSKAPPIKISSLNESVNKAPKAADSAKSDTEPAEDAPMPGQPKGGTGVKAIVKLAAQKIAAVAKAAMGSGKPLGEVHFTRVSPEVAQESMAGLCQRYPDADCELTFKNDFELLIAVILSAQTTDVTVNRVTPKLFYKYPTPKALADAPLEEIKDIIRPTGFFNNKAMNIHACSQAIVKKFGGKVPSNIEDLTTLPGVGRKTANVLLGVIHHIPSWTVDTHVQRLSKRLGYSDHSEPEKIEEELQQLFPDQDWTKQSITLIWHGRRCCFARNPDCGACPVNRLCPSSQV